MRDLKRAYNTLDDARAQLEEALENAREASESYVVSELGNVAETLDNMSDDAQEWLGVMHELGESIQDWCGRDD